MIGKRAKHTTHKGGLSLSPVIHPLQILSHTPGTQDSPVEVLYSTVRTVVFMHDTRRIGAELETRFGLREHFQC